MLLKNIIKKIILVSYNKKHNTKIFSNRANLAAKYSVGVMISEETFVADDVSIGDYSYINRASSVENCEIGKYCSISSGVYISPFEHDNAMITTHPVARTNSKPLERRKVVIGNDVLISLNVIILEGVHIGDGAVIGAGAIVTKDVLPYEIVVGMPAKHLRFRFSEKKINQLEKLQWWDWTREDILNNIDFLNSKSDGIESSQYRINK